MVACFVLLGLVFGFHRCRLVFAYFENGSRKSFILQEEGFSRSYCRAVRNNFMLKLPLPPWRFAEMHTLTELQDRLAYGQHVGAGDDFELLQKPIEEVYDIMVGTNYTCPRVEVQ